MPSKSKKQAKLMRAVAHGWKPSRIKGPTRTVAKEFVDADKRRDEVTGYQFGGGVPYRGVPPQRGMMQRGPTAMAGRMRGRPMPGRGGVTPGGPGYTPGGPGTWAGRGGIPGGGMPGGAQGLAAPWQGPGPSPMSPMGRTSGALRRYMQQRGGGGGGIFGRIQQPPGLHDVQDFSMGEGPGGRLEQQARARAEKMRGMRGPGGRMNQAQNRFGALTQGAPGGGSFGKQPPGRRIAPPPGKYPGGGNPMTRGRNPMMRGAQRYGGRRGMMR